MREQGVETLFPSLVERKKMTVKVNGKVEDAATIMNESRRRLNGSGFSSSLSSYGGTKYLINGGRSNSSSLIPPAAMDGGILRGGGGGSATVNYSASKHLTCSAPSINGKSSAGTDLESEEMETSAEAEVPGSRRVRSSAADDDALPQWGNRKRSRGSRHDSSKHGAANINPPAEESKSPYSKVASVEKRYVAHNNGMEKKHAGNSNGDAFVPKPTRCQPGLIPKHAPSVAKCTPPMSATDGPIWRNGTAANGTAMCSSSRGEARQSSVQKANVKSDLSCGRQDQQRNVSDGGGKAAEGGAASGQHGDGGGVMMKKGTKTASSSAAEDKARAIELLPWPRIVLTLTRKEKEEDFVMLRGSKLPQRPKKRPKLVEKTLLYATPGNWLGDLSRGRYEVREKKTTAAAAKKRPRGLKAMEESMMMESDSE